MIVCKFGGSSLSTADKFYKVNQIIKDNAQRKIIVLSAVGKANHNDFKLTDLLINLTNQLNGDKFDYWFDLIKLKLTTLANDLEINIDKILNFEHFKKEITQNKLTKEFIISRGEYYTSKLFATKFNYNFICSKEIISLTNDNKLDEQTTLNNLTKLDLTNKVIVPGFYVKNFMGQIALLERGGGDYSGAIISAIVGATYENYTDVNGVLNSHPSLGIKGKTITNLNYLQLNDLVCDGAQVFCKSAIPILFKNKVETCIINTQNPFGCFSKIGKYNNLFYIGKIEDYLLIPKPKKYQKSRFIKEIFKTFTLNKIKISKCFSMPFGLLIKTKNIKKLPFDFLKIKGINVVLYGKTFLIKTSKLTEYFKAQNISYIIKALPKHSTKSTIFIYGNITKDNLNKISNILSN